MNLLAIDTACSVLSIAAAKGDEITYYEADAGTKHSELIMVVIDEQMKKAGLKQNDLNGVLCMGGPGSFTGLRIGYSAAKGLALALSIPFAPIPTLDCIAYSCQERSVLTLPVIQARKDSFFYTLFRGGLRIAPDGEASICQITEILQQNCNSGEKVTITGPAAEILKNELPQELALRLNFICGNFGYAKELLHIAKNIDILHNDVSGYLYSGPDYIRKTDAELNLSYQNGGG